MNVLAIFGLQFALSLLVYSLLARWFLAPRLRSESRDRALFWLTLPHAGRHLGMLFLVPGIVSAELPGSFSAPAAYGDLLAGVLAVIVLIALRQQWRGRLALAWLFNIVGTVDLLNALSHAEVVPHLHAAMVIPTFFVPLLLVTHAMIFKRLLTRESSGRPAEDPSAA